MSSTSIVLGIDPKDPDRPYVVGPFDNENEARETLNELRDKLSKAGYKEIWWGIHNPFSKEEILEYTFGK